MEEFENYIYHYLITDIADITGITPELLFEESFIPESFWDPVSVCLTPEQINNFKIIICEEIECLICKDNKTNFKNISCCNNKICLDCINTWFNKSVFCPFCKVDQRIY